MPAGPVAGSDMVEFSMRLPKTSATSQDLTGRAILLEIGEKLGILDHILLKHSGLQAQDLSRLGGLPQSIVESYLFALAHTGLLVAKDDDSAQRTYDVSPQLATAINDAGYLLWGLMSCAPLIANAASFARDYDFAERAYVRDGEHVARTSRWMGEQDFYPHAEKAILDRKPCKIVDLGSGSCGLLIRCLRRLPHSVGVGIDLSKKACDRARQALIAEGLDGRIRIINAPIQNLIQNPDPLRDAELIHAGFVFHDLMPHEERTLDQLLVTFQCHAPQATLVIVDAVPFADASAEGAFSTAFTFLHKHFMNRKLMTQNEWEIKIAAAGYTRLDVSPLGISGGRILCAIRS